MAARLRGPSVRCVLNAVRQAGPQDSAPAGATEQLPRKGKQEHNGFRVGPNESIKEGPNQVVKRKCRRHKE